jgi:hypothetical protein
MDVLVYIFVFFFFVACIIANVYNVANIVIGGVVVLFVFIGVLIVVTSALLESIGTSSKRRFNGVKMTSTAKYTLEPTLPSAKDISDVTTLPAKGKTEQPNSAGQDKQSTSPLYKKCTINSPFGPFSNAWGAFAGFDIDTARAKIHSQLGVQSIFSIDALQYCPPPYDSPLLHEVGLPNNGEYQLYNSQTNLPDVNDIMCVNMSNDHIVASLKLLAYHAPNHLKARIIPDYTQKHVYYVIMYSDAYAPMKAITIVKISAEMPLNDKKEYIYDKIAYDNDTELPIIWPQLMIKAFIVWIHYSQTKRLYMTEPAGYIGYESLLYVKHDKFQRHLIGRDAMYSDYGDYDVYGAFTVFLRNQQRKDDAVYYGFMNPETLNIPLKDGVEILNANQQLLFLYDNKTLIDVIQIGRAYVVLHYGKENTDTFSVQCVSGEYTFSDEGLYGQVQTITKRLGVTTMTLEFAKRFLLLYAMSMNSYVME